MIKNIGDNYRIYGLIIVKNEKKLLVLDYGLSNATFETPNHAFALGKFSMNFWNPICMIWKSIKVN